MRNFETLVQVDLWVLILPLVIANILHMIVVKLNWFSALNIPVSTNLFGANKTLRGFVVLTLLNGILILPAFVHPDFSHFIKGAILGFSYMLFELPNSYFKRMAGIEAGTVPERNRWLYSLIDKSDSCFGVCLTYYFLFDLEIGRVIFLFVISIAVHILFSWLLYITEIKKSF